ncbi:hypothetical protein D9611_005928 [Ephemerocybe angulata]|uniref:CxC2-like cysteine cluster KDZ transposase-associated domain-containing protein n=1 Tax=Ephemerocybe angulata TaxID=980116 RepID=A0A8H5FLP1_9AGAR|nr:hypothetical protein D9611_005928 [Tulosesus angulatus]
MPPKAAFDRRGFKVSDLVVKRSKRGEKLKLVPVTRAKLSSILPKPPKTNTAPGKRLKTDPYEHDTHRMDPEPADDSGPDDTGPNFGDDSTESKPDPKQAYKEDLFTRHSGRTSQGYTTHEYMAAWKEAKLSLYLDEIVAAEALRSSMCERCSNTEAVWRCLNCLGTPRLCRECCLLGHRTDPFHRVERWETDHWVPAWLWHVGTIICLGHGMEPCPRYQATREGLEARCTNINEVDDFSADPSFGAKPANTTIGSGEVVAFVHTNGYHHLPVFTCFCPTSPPDEVQYLRHSFYPTTSKSVQTVFTFEVLKQVHLLKVHTHMASDSYSDILRRLTNSSFPFETIDRRRELARVWQQYNHLTNLKRNGFAHSEKGRIPAEGELALFCPACPQVDVNIPDNWKTVGPQWLYNRYLVTDGNFVLNHAFKNRSDHPVYLTDGAAFMTERTAYGEHVKSSREYIEAPLCSKHRAITDKNKAKKGYDSTGLVAVACARHGCFAPGAVVDMQKGERQLNVDYALCQALKLTNAKALPKSILAYDINCQYCINFRARVARSPKLRSAVPKDLVLDFLIGLFHVHGHKEECLHRFAPTYYPGAAINSGEILESLWSTLNGAANMTRNMTLAHRSEMLDACMSDSNWRKLQGMVEYLITRLEESTVDQDLAAVAFQKLDSTASDAQRTAWTSLMDTANGNRSITNNESMDAYNMDNPKELYADRISVAGKHAVHIQMMGAEKSGRKDQLGVADWVALGIELQEAQIKLAALLRSKTQELPTGGKKKKTQSKSAQKRDVDSARKAQAIIKLMNIFFEEAEDLFPDIKLEELHARPWGNEEEACVCEVRILSPLYHTVRSSRGIQEDCICEEERERTKSFLRGSEVELSALPLPSAFLQLPDGWEAVAEKEEALRVAQAEEALEALRNDIVQKSRLYRANRGLAVGKRERTRGYDAINEVERSMRYHVKRYNSALWALEQLGVVDRYPRFEELTRAHTTAVTSVYDPNQPGSRDEELSWIWHLNVEGDSDNSAYIEEVYRLSWIRAKSRFDRWTEELVMLKAEMEWFVRFTEYRKLKAESWAELSSTEGAKSYAYRHANMWKRMGADALVKFREKAGVKLGPISAPVKMEVKEEDLEGAGFSDPDDNRMDVEEEEPGSKIEEDELDIKSAFYNL